MAGINVNATVSDLYRIIGALSIGANPSAPIDEAQDAHLTTLGEQVVELLLLQRRERVLSTRLQDLSRTARAESGLSIVPDPEPEQSSLAPERDDAEAMGG